LRLVLQGLRELWIYAGVLVWWAVLLAAPFWPMPAPTRLAAFLLLAAAPLGFMTWRKRSLERAMYSVVSWCFHAVGLARGLLAPRRPAREAIPSVVVHEPLPDTASWPCRQARAATARPERGCGPQDPPEGRAHVQ
jgi:hypothetical protein